MADKIVEQIRHWIISFAQAYHVKPGLIFSTQLMPFLPPDCFSEFCLAKARQFGYLCSNPDLIHGIISSLRGLQRDAVSEKEGIREKSADQVLVNRKKVSNFLK